MRIPFHRETSYCTYCPKMCRHSCPVARAESSESVTPWGLMTLFHLTRSGAVPLDAETASLFWKCTGCLRCRTYCLHENEVPGALAEARRMATERGVAPAAAKETCDRMKRTGNVKGMDLRDRLNEVRARIDQGAGTGPPRALLFPGCEALAERPDDVVAAARALSALGLGPVALPIEPLCSGRPYHSMGDAEAFAAQAHKVAGALKPHALVVSTCPGCVHTLRVLYPTVLRNAQAGMGAAHVLHFTEALQGRMPERPRAPAGRAAYHDPCHLGRGLGVYTAPRDLLRAVGFTVVEFDENRQNAGCSGGGFGFPRTSPESAAIVAGARLASAPAADVIVSACPTCAGQLSQGTVPVKDVSVIVAEALGVTP